MMLRKYIFLSFNDPDEDDLWDYWSKLQKIIDQEENQYNWNRMYMIRNIDDLVIMIDKKSDQIVGFYMAHINHTRKPSKPAAKGNGSKGKGNGSKGNGSRKNRVAPKKNRTISFRETSDRKLTISLIQAFKQKKGYGTLMLIHAAQRAGMKYHNTDKLKEYISIEDVYEDAVEFYQKYNLIDPVHNESISIGS